VGERRLDKTTVISVLCYSLLKGLCMEEPRVNVTAEVFVVACFLSLSHAATSLS
jgi:hypothetical protein